MGDNRFASVPNISIPRSRFKQPFNHSYSMNHGYLVPADCFDILPGDTYKLDLASVIWMSNPIRPLFGNITCHVDVFFVPMRLVWDNTQAFFGENKTSAGYQQTSYKIPNMKLSKSLNPSVHAVSAYLGKPIYHSVSTSTQQVAVSVLKERGYYLIWNNYYRAQQLQAPIAVATGGNGTVSGNNAIGTYAGQFGTTALTFADEVLQVNKEFDYFTAATTSPQYGPAVTLPLGTYAPVGLIDPLASGTVTAGVVNPEMEANLTSSRTFVQAEGTSSNDGNNTVLKFVTDLSSATAATINTLRYAFAVQKYLERSNFGSRFFEMLQVHYGVTSPDATLQIPQRIGHADFAINISTVLSTAGAAADASTELGAPGATSCTANKSYLFTHSFCEPGFLYVMVSTTHERSYTQGILREDMKLDRYEIYSPEFANLGDQEIKNCEIYYGADAYNNDVFGYQEHWAEYRYRPHRTSGWLNNQVANALDFWVLTDEYTQRPALDGSWIKEDRDWVSNCLVSGSSGPDYIVDMYFDYTATREMPLFTIPGLIDHFGVR